MPAHVEGFPLPHHSVRRILTPVLGWAFVATVLAVIRRYTRQPSVTPMSEHWLLSHQVQFGRDDL